MIFPSKNFLFFLFFISSFIACRSRGEKTELTSKIKTMMSDQEVSEAENTEEDSFYKAYDGFLENYKEDLEADGWEYRDLGGSNNLGFYEKNGRLIKLIKPVDVPRTRMNKEKIKNFIVDIGFILEGKDFVAIEFEKCEQSLGAYFIINFKGDAPAVKEENIEAKRNEIFLNVARIVLEKISAELGLYKETGYFNWDNHYGNAAFCNSQVKMIDLDGYLLGSYPTNYDLISSTMGNLKTLRKHWNEIFSFKMSPFDFSGNPELIAYKARAKVKITAEEKRTQKEEALKAIQETLRESKSDFDESLKFFFEKDWSQYSKEVQDSLKKIKEKIQEKEKIDEELEESYYDALNTSSVDKKDEAYDIDEHLIVLKNYYSKQKRKTKLESELQGETKERTLNFINNFSLVKLMWDHFPEEWEEIQDKEQSYLESLAMVKEWLEKKLATKSP